MCSTDEEDSDDSSRPSDETNNSDDTDDTEKQCDCSIRYSSLKGVSKLKIKQLERCKSILEKIRNSRNNDGSFCDSIIKVENVEFPVHKIVLTSNSTYFEAMYNRPFNEQNEKCINLKGVTKDIFAIIIDFLYGAIIEISEETLPEIYQAADMFCIDSLIVDCQKYFKDNWCSFENNVYPLVELMNAEEVRKRICEEIFEFLKKKQTESKYDLDQLAIDLPFSFMEKLMEKANSEETVLSILNLLLKWITVDRKNRLSKVEYINKSLRLHLLPWSFIEEFLAKIENMFKRQDLLDQIEFYQKTFKSDSDEPRNKISIFGSKIYTVFVDENFEAKIDCFNCEDFQWNPSISVKLPFEVQDCLYNNSHIYFMGNQKMMRYTPDTKSVEYLPEMTIGRLNYSACFLKNDIILAGGSVEENNSSKKNAQQILRFHSSNNTWQPAILNWNKPNMECSLITRGKNVFIVRSERVNPIKDGSEASITGTVFKFIPNKKKISKVCELGQTYNKPYLAIYDNKLYVFRRDIDFTKFLYNAKVVDLKTRRVSYLRANNCGPNQITLIGTCAISEGILLISSTNVEGIDQIYVALLKSSGKVEPLGFLPKESSISNLNI